MFSWLLNSSWAGKIARKMLSGFDNTSSGWSAKKMSAFVVIFASLIMQGIYIYWNVTTEGDGFKYLPHLVDANLLFAGLCLGINEWKKKNKKDEESVMPPAGGSIS